MEATAHQDRKAIIQIRRFPKRVLDIFVSIIALILFSPLVLVTEIAREIESIENHVFLNSKNVCLPGRMFNWFQFVVLIVFAPAFAIMKTPLRIKPKKRYSISKKAMVADGVAEQHKFSMEPTQGNYRHKKQRPRPSTFLQMTWLTKVSQLIHVLKGDISLFGARPFDVAADGQAKLSS